ncbi:SIS domain-containing protein [Acidianus sp. HS-5]|uniref:SIS domain-containing protein n=1 Tax=Acidianus sp. HS-5 TaxID=2886040 RepID=UPI001F022A2F|nr:SIS domain-containing protein [Acidianus sp. HS-5]BDC18151.1 sugar isomerase [Acidianus sp. HS-5]
MEIIEDIEEEISQNYTVNTDVRLGEAYVTGAGDSFAASLVIEGKTKGKFRAIDPYDALWMNINKPLIIVSVSGKPKSNISLARKFKGRTKIYVITANPNSELAKLADEVINLPYKPKRVLPGTLSFMMSLSALYKIAGVEEDKGRDKEIILEDKAFFIGKGENYGIAYFAYLKLAEIFGWSSNFERLEQFFHSPIFSSRSREVVVFSSGDEREKTIKKLMNINLTECEGAFCNLRTLLKSLIYTMKSKGWNKIYFLEDKETLNISSTMIY